ncbi:unnamed protein product [Onchocerca flexuosa]|uniref:Uncharacterized protein n=1 Tax=Onchocerca flexuosa TaxID=387005 RepID=A0A183HQR0_9BILA|nr:unnamed protein product [Onchocerca flexuosa]
MLKFILYCKNLRIMDTSQKQFWIMEVVPVQHFGPHLNSGENESKIIS